MHTQSNNHPLEMHSSNHAEEKQDHDSVRILLVDCDARKVKFMQPGCLVGGLCAVASFAFYGIFCTFDSFIWAGAESIYYRSSWPLIKTTLFASAGGLAGYFASAAIINPMVSVSYGLGIAIKVGSTIGGAGFVSYPSRFLCSFVGKVAQHPNSFFRKRIIAMSSQAEESKVAQEMSVVTPNHYKPLV